MFVENELLRSRNTPDKCQRRLMVPVWQPTTTKVRYLSLLSLHFHEKKSKCHVGWLCEGFQIFISIIILILSLWIHLCNFFFTKWFGQTSQSKCNVCFHLRLHGQRVFWNKEHHSFFLLSGKSQRSERKSVQGHCFGGGFLIFGVLFN